MKLPLWCVASLLAIVTPVLAEGIPVNRETGEITTRHAVVDLTADKMRLRHMLFPETERQPDP